MLIDGRGFGKQAIERDHGRDSRKQGEQPIKDHAGRDGQKAIFSDTLVGPPQDVFPTPRRDLPRRGGMPAPARLERPPLLRGPGLFGLPGRGLAGRAIAATERDKSGRFRPQTPLRPSRPSREEARRQKARRASGAASSAMVDVHSGR